MNKEYIERKTITKLAKEIKDNFAPLHRAVIDAFIYYIETNISTADVVEVVRCKDCKWWDNETRCRNVNGLNHIVWNGEWFCASGQRKEGTENGRL